MMNPMIAIYPLHVGAVTCHFTFISHFSVKDYIENVNGFLGLVDKLSKNIMPESYSKDALYTAHLTPSQIHNGIRNNKLYQGTFHASRDNFLEGTATISGFEKPVSIMH